MATARPVQFRGSKAVLRAYENADIAPFAIMCGNQLIMKYDVEGANIEGGKQFLDSALRELSTAGALATYTLQLYDDLPKDERIRSKTEFCMSFNFKLEEFEEELSRRYSSRQYEDRIAGLEDRLKKFEEDENNTQPEAIGGVWGAINEIFKHPDIQAAIAGKFVSVIHAIGAPPAVDASLPEAFPASKVAGTGDRHDAEQMEQIRRAIDVLVKLDPNLGDHLVQIAEIAMKQPEQYNLLISMLKK